jgi:SAM-dependent methyltransferase
MPELARCRNREEYLAFANHPDSRKRRELEHALLAEITASHKYRPIGYCAVCGRGGRFDVRVDRRAPRVDGVLAVNLRETLTCPLCGLNNRQRLVATHARVAAGDVLARGTRPVVYAMEQVTAFFHWLSKLEAECEAIGSEYLGPEVASGTVVKGVRHEDATELTLADASVDVVVSNDVLEHVPEPERAVAEMRRVLRPGGTALCTFPFLDQAETRVRARRRPGGGIEHLWPESWHGNPVSAKGSLVYREFGWDVLETFRSRGFESVHMLACWNLEELHVGGPQLLLVCG